MFSFLMMALLMSASSTLLATKQASPVSVPVQAPVAVVSETAAAQPVKVFHPNDILPMYPGLKATSFKDLQEEERHKLSAEMKQEHERALQSYLLLKINKQTDGPDVAFENFGEIDIQTMALTLDADDIAVVKVLIGIKKKGNEKLPWLKRMILTFADRVQRAPENGSKDQQKVAYQALHNYINHLKAHKENPS